MQPLSYNESEPMPEQQLSWTCSACSLAWLNRALGIDWATSELTAVDYIGQPENINAMYGLMDGSGSVLAARLREQGAPAFTCWLPYEVAWEMACRWPLLVGGVGWNHWVGVRRCDEEDLLIANSAPGWMSIYDRLSEADWIRLGPFACVPVPLLQQFPPQHG